ncbi:MAG: hypothetical protein ACYDHN_05485, partial [Solirubrobacteraceae bacterium]
IERNEEAERREAAKGEEEAELEEEVRLREELEESEKKAKTVGWITTVITSAPAATTPAPPAPAPATATASSTPTLSALALTVKAIVALNASHPRLTKVSFTFDLNLPTQVRFALAKRVRVHHHSRWQPFGSALTTTAKSGANTQTLKGRSVLKAGLYRLTATPAHGKARSILFRIG